MHVKVLLQKSHLKFHEFFVICHQMFFLCFTFLMNIPPMCDVFQALIPLVISSLMPLQNFSWNSAFSVKSLMFWIPKIKNWTFHGSSWPSESEGDTSNIIPPSTRPQFMDSDVPDESRFGTSNSKIFYVKTYKVKTT